MIPLSLAHRLIETHSPCKDIWRVLHPESSIGSAEDEVEKARRRPIPTAEHNLLENGACSDSVICTWRWDKSQQSRLGVGKPKIEIPGDTIDPKAKRLDYIFASVELPSGSENDEIWTVKSAKVGMTERHPELDCSLSDHFAVVCTLARIKSTTQDPINADDLQNDSGARHRESSAYDTQISSHALDTRYLPIVAYDEILSVAAEYNKRQRFQRRIRTYHFLGSVILSVGCLVAVWWSPRNFVAFLLMLLSTLNLAWGVIDGLQGLLFVGSELRALKEFEWEIRNARTAAGGTEASGEQGHFKEW